VTLPTSQRQHATGIGLVPSPHNVGFEPEAELAFANGIVVTPDNKTIIVAESFAARLTAFDIADDGTLSHRRVSGPTGSARTASTQTAASGPRAQTWRTIREGGEILERIDPGRPCLATMLGGPARRTLFVLTADWRGTEGV
jgi:sugar lactone lactonase YvrE